MNRVLSPVLIVDDEKENLEALRRLLRNDFEVVSCQSAAEALDILKKSRDRFDVIVSDQRMPGMTGSELFSEILKIDTRPTRILLTGFADLEAVIEAVNKGHIWRYISKPWEPEDLKQTLRQAAERTRMSRSLDKSRRELERALTELRAKDWSRERLLQILLHEFRTAPQVLENLKSINDSSEDSPLRLQMIERLNQRFSLLAQDILALLEEEKQQSQIPKELVPLKTLVQSLSMEMGFEFSFESSSADLARILANSNQLRDTLRHFFDLMKKNSQNAALRVSLDVMEGSAQTLAYLSLKLQASSPILPQGLSQQALDSVVAWNALLEPFVGVEDFKHHSTGLRVDTAKKLRLLSALGARPEFQISGNGTQVELLIVFKTSNT